MIEPGGDTLLLLALQMASAAGACSLVVPGAHGVAPTRDDDNAPTAISGEIRVEVHRGRGPVEVNGACGGSSCDDVGHVRLTFAAASDDDDDPGADTASPSDDRLQPGVGYRLQLRSGALASGLTLPATPQAAWLSEAGDATVLLVWLDGATDHQEPFSAEVSVEPVDAAGNIGPARRVTIADDGRAATTSPCAGDTQTGGGEADARSGCQVAGGGLGGAAGIGLLGLVGRVGRRRTGLSAPARRAHGPARARRSP
jgi:hypothetical protein